MTPAPSAWTAATAGATRAVTRRAFREVCPDCDGTVVRSCPECGSSIRSLMALTCPCGHVYREDVFFGRPIRRKAERHDLRAPECAGEVATSLDITASL